MNRFILLLAAALIGGCATNSRTSSAPASGSHGVLSIRTELFFGLSRPDGSLVSAEEWTAFLDEHILQRFPEGLTVFEATGRYRDAQGRTVKEPSRVVMLFYNPDDLAVANSNITAIAAEYRTQFHQESVLRADSLENAAFLSAPAAKLINATPANDAERRR